MKVPRRNEHFGLCERKKPLVIGDWLVAEQAFLPIQSFGAIDQEETTRVNLLHERAKSPTLGEKKKEKKI